MHAVLACDSAGGHQPGEHLRVPDTITLLHLPPYSPELNPMENVRDHLRGNQLSHTVWDDYDAIVQACDGERQFLINDSGRIQSIAIREGACVSVYAGWSQPPN